MQPSSSDRSATKTLGASDKKVRDRAFELYRRAVIEAVHVIGGFMHLATLSSTSSCS